MSTVLVVDDDPSHLKLYSWIIERGGFRAISALVRQDKVDLPCAEPIDVAVLDYRLGGQLTAVDVARQLKTDRPALPIFILSDVMWMPEDVAPYAAGFVRKGEPQQLLDTIASALQGNSSKT